MPGMTPLGIVYPCGDDTIDPDVFAQYASTTQDALTATDVIALKVTRPPAAQVSRFSAVQSIAAGVSTAVSWTTEYYDTDGLFTLASPTILTVQSAGTYMVSNKLTEVSNPTTGTSLRQAILLNGVERGFNKSDGLTGAYGYAAPQWVSAFLINLVAGDQVSVNILFTGTGNMGIWAHTSITRLSTT